MIYKDKLANLREEKNLKLRDIDKILDLQIDTYRKFESEKTIMPISRLNVLCNFFNVSIDYVFGFSKKKKYDNFNEEIDNLLSGNRLKEFRKDNKLSQKELGEILNCSYGTIAGYESGRYIIATPFLYEICKKYKISADYLLGKIDDPKYLK